MPDLLKLRKLTARKAHPCCICTAPAVQPGETYERRTYVYDGQVYDWVNCKPCNDLISVVADWSSADEGVGQEDFAEWAGDHKDDPDHSEAARAFLVRAGIAELEAGR